MVGGTVPKLDNISVQPLQYRLEEAADMLRVNATTLRRWCRAGTCAFVRLPTGDLRIPATEIRRLSTPSAS